MAPLAAVVDGEVENGDAARLRAGLVGASLFETSSPSAVLDLKLVKESCEVLQVVKELGLAWRPHIKTHKVLNLPRHFLVGKGRSELTLEATRQSS